MIRSRLNIVLVVLFASLVVGLPQSNDVFAQGFPNRPVTVISPFTAGTPIDQAFRVISQEVSRTLGQPMVVDIRAGANGRLGVTALKTAPADGHLLAIVFDSLLVAQPVLDPTFQLEMGKDYVPVAFLTEFPLLLVATASVPFRDLKGLIDHAKQNPGKLNVAGTAGSSSYFSAERFRQEAGIGVTMVPYKGSSQAMTDLIAGRVHLLFAAAGVVNDFIAAGKLAAVATTGSARWTAFPTVPTLTEQGMPLAMTAWFGVVAPHGTPQDVVGKLNNAVVSALNRPEILKQIVGYGMTTISRTKPEDFGDFIRAESIAWGGILRKSGIKLE